MKKRKAWGLFGWVHVHDAPSYFSCHAGVSEEPALGALMLSLSHLAAPWLTETDKTSDSSLISEKHPWQS